MQFPSTAKALNGLVALREDVLLAADSFACCIWRIDLQFNEDGIPTDAHASEWMTDSAFDGRLVLPDFQPGVNGLKYSSTANAVVFSSTQQRLMGKIPVDPEPLMPNGPPVILLTWITRNNSIIRVPINSENGRHEVVAWATPHERHVYGPTAGVWKRGKEGRTAYFSCDGGLKNPFPREIPEFARVLKIDFADEVSGLEDEA